MNVKGKAITLVVAVSCFAAAGENQAAEELRETREFKSAPALVWEAWTRPRIIQKWWGPNGFVAPKVDVHLEVGSATLVCMQAEGTPLLCNTWTYTLISPLRELHFDSRFAGPDGSPMRPADIGLPAGIPDVVPHRIIFEELAGGGTRLTVHETGYTAAEAAALSREGLRQVLDKLQAVVP